MATASFSVIPASLITLYGCANNFSSSLVHIRIYNVTCSKRLGVILLLPHARASLSTVMPDIAVDSSFRCFPYYFDGFRQAKIHRGFE
jgi:hypothetical protein